MYFLVRFCIKILKKIKKILIIIQRSNGDVFLSSNLIAVLQKYYESVEIDLLINNDTYSIAKLLPEINHIHQFSYFEKKHNRWIQEKNIIKKIFRNYDLSINLTASDRSVIYALFASKNSISAIEKNKFKSWWKFLFLSHSYYFNSSDHILINNSQPLKCLKIKYENVLNSLIVSDETILNVKRKLDDKGINDFIIFHPSAQYNYKIYPKKLRNKLLDDLNKLGIPILITGSNSLIDMKIKKEIPKAENIYDFIGQTSLEEYFALSQLSFAYIGMDTLNMHIAASQNKYIFAIFGPTKLSMWSPWSNISQKATKVDKPLQSYDNITIFQSSLPCEVCGITGCGSNHSKDKVNFVIKPEEIFNEVEKWYIKMKH